MPAAPRSLFVVATAALLAAAPTPAWAHHRDWATESGLPWWNVGVVVGLALLLLVEAALLLGFGRRAQAPLLERVWTMAPLFLLTALGIVLLARPLLLARGALARLDPAAVGADALVVEVRARQFDWIFNYPAEQVMARTELHVPADRPVLLRAQSDDVLHSLDVPRLGLRCDIPYGAPTALAFRATRAGRYALVCTALCGTGAQEMGATLVVDPPAAFAAWVRGQAETAARR